jgi:hypothetical protein
VKSSPQAAVGGGEIRLEGSAEEEDAAGGMANPKDWKEARILGAAAQLNKLLL